MASEIVVINVPLEESIEISANNDGIADEEIADEGIVDEEIAEEEIADDEIGNEGIADETQQNEIVNDGDIEFHFTVGMRTNSQLIYTTADKQLFKREKKCGDIHYYRCKEKSCPVRLIYNSALNKCMRKKSDPHTHGDQGKIVKTATVRKSIIDQCKEMSNSAERNKSTVNDLIYEKLRQ